MITETAISQYIDKIPGLPNTVSKIIGLSNNNKSTANDFINVIKLDPVLTGKVLRLINSAYFGLPSKVTSITRATILLGINTLKNLSLSTSIISSINIKKDIPDFNIDKFWEHSLACATICKNIAKLMKVDKNLYEEYFIAGLIHDIGKVFLIQYVEEYKEVLKLVASGEHTLIEEENNLLQIDHAQIGGIICKKWQLAEGLISAITRHHSHDIIKENDDMKLILSLYLANIITNKKGFNINKFDESKILINNIWKRLGILESELEHMCSSLNEDIERARIFLVQ